jgi:hypothetical protein
MRNFFFLFKSLKQIFWQFQMVQTQLNKKLFDNKSFYSKLKQRHLRSEQIHSKALGINKDA